MLISTGHLHFLLFLLELKFFDMRASAVIHELGLAVGDLCVLRLVFLVVILEVLGIIRGSISLLEAF